MLVFLVDELAGIHRDAEQVDVDLDHDDQNVRTCCCHGCCAGECPIQSYSRALVYQGNMVAALPCCLLPWLLSLQEKTYILQGVVEVVVVGGHDLMEACKVVMQIWMA